MLRGGKVTGTVDPRNESNASLSRLMIGAEPPKLNHRAVSTGAVALSAQNLSIATDDPFGVSLSDIAFEVRAGEVVGIAGVSATASRELLAALSAKARVPRPAASVCSATTSPGATRACGAAGGLHLFRKNALAAARCQRSLASTHCSRVPASSSAAPLGWVSPKAPPRRRRHHPEVQRQGRWPAIGSEKPPAATCRNSSSAARSARKPKVLIVSQPTWGVDVGAAAQIRGELLELRDAGCAVLVVSEELDELFEVCDRMHVTPGRLSPSIATNEATVEKIGEWMSGLWGGVAA